MTHEYKHWLRIVKHSLTCAHVSLLICGDTLQHICTLTHSITHTPYLTHPYSPPLTPTHHHSLSLIYHSVLTHPSLTTHLPLIPHSLALTSSSPLLAFALIDPRYNPIDISLGNPSHPVDISPNNLVRCTSHSVHCTLYSSRGNMPHLE